MKFGDMQTLVGSFQLSCLYGLHSGMNFEQMADSAESGCGHGSGIQGCGLGVQSFSLGLLSSGFVDITAWREKLQSYFSSHFFQDYAARHSCRYTFMYAVVVSVESTVNPILSFCGS